jgi:hypothetical protein
MTETVLRAYLDRLAQVRSRFEVHQQDVREMLISLDGVFEALCRELQETRGPLKELEGPDKRAEAPHPAAYEPVLEAPRPGEDFNLTRDPTGPNAMDASQAFNPDGFGNSLYQSVIVGHRSSMLPWIAPKGYRLMLVKEDG